DNPNPNGMPPLCSMGKDCVQSATGCGCAAPCDLTKEFPCPGGQSCVDVKINGQPAPQKYCLPDPCANGCENEKKTGANSKIVCAPAGTDPDPTTCAVPPVCVCKGLNDGCQNPC